MPNDWKPQPGDRVVLKRPLFDDMPAGTRGTVHPATDHPGNILLYGVWVCWDGFGFWWTPVSCVSQLNVLDRISETLDDAPVSAKSDDFTRLLRKALV